MISRSPIAPLQAAVWQRLAADDTLMAMVSGVFDRAPEPATLPYITMGVDTLSTPDNAHDQFGRQVTMTVHVWTDARGMAPGQAIATRVNELLDHQHRELFPDGHRVVSIRSEFDHALTDPNPHIRHHVVRYRIFTAQQEGS